MLRKRRHEQASELGSTESNYPANNYPSELGGGLGRGKAELGYNPVPMENLQDRKIEGTDISEMAGSEGRVVSEVGGEGHRVELP